MTPTILIVDDDNDTRAMYAEIFRKQGFRVHTAMDGLEGVELATTHAPDVIFTGIVMPRMDGFRMMEALAQEAQTRDIPVAINSHMGRSADRARAEQLGAKDFIVREMTPPSEVVDRIRSLVTRDETFVLEPDLYARDAEALAQKFATESGLLQCPNGQKMTMRITITDSAARSGTVQFLCE